MLCVYIEVVRVANDLLNCLEVEVGVTLVGALAPSAHYTHIPSKPLTSDLVVTSNLFLLSRRGCYNQNTFYREMKAVKVVEKRMIC